MKTLELYLKEKCDDQDLVDVLMGVSDAVIRVSEAMRVSADIGKAGSHNVYGEEQIALDLLADSYLQEELRKVPACSAVASEELPAKLLFNEAGKYCVAYDPLDGSSIADVNFSVGTILGVYDGQEFIGRRGEEQQAALIVVYGPKTTMVITVDETTDQFALMDGKFVLENQALKIRHANYFAPGNLRAVNERQDYMDLVLYWMKEGYTLRYSGGFVPDINHILVKEGGIFTYPGYSKHPDGKLRLLFECNPISLLVERAGGKAYDGVGRVLEQRVNSLEQRSPIYVGSPQEVDRAQESLK